VNYARQAILYQLAKLLYRKGRRTRAKKLLYGLMFQDGVRHRDVSRLKLAKYIVKCQANL
jgi:hypothetical protein